MCYGLKPSNPPLKPERRHMAVPADFPEANFTLKPAPGTEDTVTALVVHHTPATEVTPPVLTSCWKLTPDELAEVTKTGVVWLHVLGETSYPVAVTGTNPFVQESPGAQTA